MAIRNTSGKSEINSYFMKVRQRVDQAIFLRLSKLGEELVTYAKLIPASVGYTDRTGNLRASTGYIVSMKGSVIKESFAEVQGEVEGSLTGAKYATSIAAAYPDTNVLIVVAGMEYALAVESRGRDVLTSTLHIAEKKLPIELRKLKEAIKTMKV